MNTKKNDLTNAERPHNLLNSPQGFVHDFLRCGTAGLLTEVCFTALHSLQNRDMSLKGTTSLRMFPIYGMAAGLRPLIVILRKNGISALSRGSIYTACIFAAEYISGNHLRKKKHCPWDYHRSRYHVQGLIRLDFAPWWFLFGLVLEKVLCTTPSQTTTTSD